MLLGQISRSLVAGELFGQRLCRGGLGLLPALLGCGCLGFLDLFGLLGGKTLFLGRLGRGRCLLLLGLVGALGCEPRLCFFSLARLLGCSGARLFGGNILQLRTGEARIEPVGISLQESFPRVPISRLQR